MSYYDRTGQRVTQEEGLKLLTADRTVGRTQIGDYLVSTVHLVINHGLTWSSPLIFETMVFKGDSWLDEYAERYSTEEQARDGHEHVVGMVRELVELGSA